jgi:hypothetical protein
VNYKGEINIKRERGKMGKILYYSWEKYVYNIGD